MAMTWSRRRPKSTASNFSQRLCAWAPRIDRHHQEEDTPKKCPQGQNQAADLSWDRDELNFDDPWLSAVEGTISCRSPAYRTALTRRRTSRTQHGRLKCSPWLMRCCLTCRHCIQPAYLCQHRHGCTTVAAAVSLSLSLSQALTPRIMRTAPSCQVLGSWD